MNTQCVTAPWSGERNIVEVGLSLTKRPPVLRRWQGLGLGFYQWPFQLAGASCFLIQKRFHVKGERLNEMTPGPKEATPSVTGSRRPSWTSPFSEAPGPGQKP